MTPDVSLGTRILSPVGGEVSQMTAGGHGGGGGGGGGPGGSWSKWIRIQCGDPASENSHASSMVILLHVGEPKCWGVERGGPVWYGGFEIYGHFNVPHCDTNFYGTYYLNILYGRLQCPIC